MTRSGLSARPDQDTRGRPIYDFWTMPPSVMKAHPRLAVDLAPELSDNSCRG